MYVHVKVSSKYAVKPTTRKIESTEVGVGMRFNNLYPCSNTPVQQKSSIAQVLSADESLQVSARQYVAWIQPPPTVISVS